MSSAGLLTYDQEEWEIIDEFPEYEVSTEGRVLTRKTGHIKVPTQNQFDVPSVLLVRGGQHFRRSVPLLVATQFIPKPNPKWDCPININGDRLDNRVRNLAWRPRWFAVKYNVQFSEFYVPAANTPVVDQESGKIYQSTWHAAVANGLLDTDVWLSILNRTITFPTNQRFKLVE